MKNKQELLKKTEKLAKEAFDILNYYNDRKASGNSLNEEEKVIYEKAYIIWIDLNEMRVSLAGEIIYSNDDCN